MQDQRVNMTLPACFACSIPIAGPELSQEPSSNNPGACGPIECGSAPADAGIVIRWIGKTDFLLRHPSHFDLSRQHESNWVGDNMFSIRKFHSSPRVWEGFPSYLPDRPTLSPPSSSVSVSAPGCALNSTIAKIGISSISLFWSLG